MPPLAGSTVTATSVGDVVVTATVAAEGTWRGATLSHRLAIRNPANLSLTSPPGTLAVQGTHTFAASTDGNTPITWSVTGTDGSPTTLATINPMTGALTANGAGQVRVTARVAGDATYSGDTSSHTLEITLIPATLMITPTPSMDTLELGDMYDFAATSNNAGAVITWSVTGTDDTPTTLATIVPSSGLLTASGLGQVKVVATLAEDATYSGLTTSYTLTLARADPNLAITTPITEIAQGGAAITLTTTTDSSAPVTWSINDGTLATLTDNMDGTATLTPLTTTGMVTVTAEVAETTTHTTDSTTLDITIKQSPNLRLVSPVATLEATATHTFAAMTDGNTPITWGVTDSDGSPTTRATIGETTGLLTALESGTVQITASVAADADFVAATAATRSPSPALMPTSPLVPTAPPSHRARGPSPLPRRRHPPPRSPGALTMTRLPPSPTMVIARRP